MVGGVADYSERVAEGLVRAGHTVHVWAPGFETRTEETASQPAVNRTLGRFSLGRIMHIDRLMGTPRGKYLLLQWEPVGFGLRSMNLPFCLWIATRALRGTRLLVMFHETFVPLSFVSAGRIALGIMQRFISSVLVNAAGVAFTSNEAGFQGLRRLCLRPDKVHKLPVFSNIEEDLDDLDDPRQTRARFLWDGEILVGHFGRVSSSRVLVLPPLAELLRRNDRVKVLFIGECGQKYRTDLLAANPEFAHRVFASEIGSPKMVAGLIVACDFMFQLYPGGLTTKRSSTMAAIAHGKCVVSNIGPETEALWQHCPGLYLIDKGDTAGIAEALNELASSAAEAKARGRSASRFYQEHFSARKVIDAILSCLGRQ